MDFVNLCLSCDWCLIDALFVLECWTQLHVRFHLTELGEELQPRKLAGGGNPDSDGWAFNPWSCICPLPEEMIWTMWYPMGRRLSGTWRRRFVRPDRPGKCDLVVAVSMRHKGPTATRRVTCNMCSVVRLKACATTVTTSYMHSSRSIKPVTQTAIAKGPNSAGNLGHLTDPLHHLQPSVEPQFSSTFSSSQRRVPRLYFLSVHCHC